MVVCNLWRDDAPKSLMELIKSSLTFVSLVSVSRHTSTRLSITYTNHNQDSFDISQASTVPTDYLHNSQDGEDAQLTDW